jgi:hypothetical protein
MRRLSGEGEITYGRLSSRLLGHLGVPEFGTFCHPEPPWV